MIIAIPSLGEPELLLTLQSIALQPDFPGEVRLYFRGEQEISRMSCFRDLIKLLQFNGIKTVTQNLSDEFRGIGKTRSKILTDAESEDLLMMIDDDIILVYNVIHRLIWKLTSRKNVGFAVPNSLMFEPVGERKEDYLEPVFI